MSERRFFINEELAGLSELSLRKATYPDELHHLTRVLRLKVGDEVILTNGRGQEARGSLVVLEKEIASIKISSLKESPPLGPKIFLCQSVLKSGKMDWLIEKITEVGVSELYPLLTEFTVRSDAPQRTERWLRVAQAAVKQSENPILPIFHPAQSLPEALKSLSGVEKIFLHPGAPNSLFASLEKLNFANGVAIFIGPEGGWSASEVKFLEDQGVRAANLGTNILRGESAGIIASAITSQAIAFWAH